MRHNNIQKNTAILGILHRRYDEKEMAWRFAVNWKRLALLSACLLVLVWLFAAALVYSAFKFVRKYDEISISQVLTMPFALSRHKQQMGEYNIRQAEKNFAEGNLAEGFLNLQSGVARSPDNLDARLKLAYIYHDVLRDNLKAAKIVDAKIAKAFEEKNAKYLTGAIYFYSASADYREKAVSLAGACAKNSALGQKDLISALGVSMQKFGAEKKFRALGQYCADMAAALAGTPAAAYAAKNGGIAYSVISENQKAAELLNAAGVNSGDVFYLVSAAQLIAQSRELEALRLVKKAASASRNKKNSYEFLAAIREDFGDEKGSADASKMAMLSSSDIADPVLAEIEFSDVKNARETAEKFIARFPDRATKLSSVAVKRKDLEILEMCSRGKLTPAAQTTLLLSKAEIYIKLGNPKDATVALDAVKYSDYIKSVKTADFLDGFYIAVNALSDKDTSEALSKFYANPENDVPSYTNLASLLYASNLKTLAKTVALTAVEKYPKNVKAAQIFCEAATDQGDYASIFEAMKKYGIRVPVKILATLDKRAKGDRFIFLDRDFLASVESKSADAREKLELYKKNP